MVLKIVVNIGTGNGLVPSGTKPLPERMLHSDFQGDIETHFSEILIKYSISNIPMYELAGSLSRSLCCHHVKIRWVSARKLTH